MSDVPTDVHWMNMAIRLAAKGRGLTSPNPMAGAVVVAKGTVVGKGYHRRAGEPHAEVFALQQAGPRARGATLYVTLEPCCHKAKRTPPCVPLVMASKVKRVVVAMRDPNPLVKGRGIAQLRRAGISVDVGYLQKEAEHLNEIFGHWVRTGQPFVIVKAAMTLDGKIATATGASQWITGDLARRQVHALRNQVDAILTGIGTVLKDNPQLTARWPHKGSPKRPLRQPVRVILDSTLRIPPSSRVLQWLVQNPTIIATTHQANRNKIVRLRQRGAQVLVLPTQRGRVNLVSCLRQLGRMGLTSVLVEGGSEVNASAFRSGHVSKVLLYVAPMVLGGAHSKSLVGGPSPTTLTDSIRLRDIQVQPVGQDMLISAYVAKGRR